MAEQILESLANPKVGLLLAKSYEIFPLEGPLGSVIWMLWLLLDYYFGGVIFYWMNLSGLFESQR